MRTEYLAVSLPAAAGPIVFNISSEVGSRFRVRAVVLTCTIDANDQFTVALARGGQAKLLAASEQGLATIPLTVVWGIGISPTPAVMAIPTAQLLAGALHDVWIDGEVQATVNANAANMTPATIGVWVDRE